MDVNTVKCDICARQKAEVNHWLVAITRPGFEGILFVPVEAAEEPRNPDFVYQDICGQGCAIKRLSAALDDINAVFNQAPEESVTA
jgi:hypothetical protein